MGKLSSDNQYCIRERKRKIQHKADSSNNEATLKIRKVEKNGNVTSSCNSITWIILF